MSNHATDVDFESAVYAYCEHFEVPVGTFQIVGLTDPLMQRNTKLLQDAVKSGTPLTPEQVTGMNPTGGGPGGIIY